LAESISFIESPIEFIAHRGALVDVFHLNRMDFEIRLFSWRKFEYIILQNTIYTYPI